MICRAADLLRAQIRRNHGLLRIPNIGPESHFLGLPVLSEWYMAARQIYLIASSLLSVAVMYMRHLRGHRAKSDSKPKLTLQAWHKNVTAPVP